MIPAATLSHATTGRVRLRIPAMRGDADYFRAVEQGLSPHFQAVQGNPATGSVVVWHAALSSEELRRVAAEQGLFDLTNEKAPEPRMRLDWDLGIENWSAAAAGLLLVLAAVQLSRGRVLTSSVSLLWYAAEAFRWSRGRG